MSYEPTTWKAGDTVTSAKLNKMEQGIANHNAVEIIIDYANTTITLNKTWQEIWDNNYTNIVFIPDNNNPSVKHFIYIQGLQINNGTYSVKTFNLETQVQTILTCNSPDDYPSYQS